MVHFSLQRKTLRRERKRQSRPIALSRAPGLPVFGAQSCGSKPRQRVCAGRLTNCCCERETRKLYDKVKKIFKNYKNLIGLLLVIMLAVALFNLGMSGPICFALVACWQLLQFARSPRVGACFVSVLTDKQITDLTKALNE